jgi:hypothetical protein
LNEENKYLSVLAGGGFQPIKKPVFHQICADRIPEFKPHFEKVLIANQFVLVHRDLFPVALIVNLAAKLLVELFGRLTNLGLKPLQFTLKLMKELLTLSR